MKIGRFIAELLIFTFFLSESALFAEFRGYHDERIYVRAEITDIQEKKISTEADMDLMETTVILKILEGELAGQTKKALFRGENDMPAEMTYHTGDKIFIGISPSADEDSVESVSLYDKDNTPAIIFMSALLILTIIIIGRWRGLAALAALVVTVILLFTVLIPLTLKGYSPLPVAVIISAVSVIITMPIIAGLHLKTLGASLGAVCGIILSSLIAIGFSMIMQLSGLITNEMLTVFYASSVPIQLKGLMLSGMIIAALGAIMDVCISIASSTEEIFNANPDIAEKDALKSVLTIGKDILGSMVNTLILAYVGSSLALILVIAMRLEPEMPVRMVLNYNPVLSEFVKSVTGSLGMFFCIPLTAVISVKLHGRKRRLQLKEKKI